MLVENQQEKGVLELMRNWRKQGWSLRRIASELNDRNIAAKKGGIWYSSSVGIVIPNG